MMKFGKTVNVCRVYERRMRYRSNVGRPADRVKEWQVVDVAPREAIYLGERTLANGTTDWWAEEGITFTPDKEGYFRAALVCFSAHENPVYAPLDSISSVCNTDALSSASAPRVSADGQRDRGEQR